MIPVTCFFAHNIRRDKYMSPSTCFLPQNMKSGIYLRPDRLQILYYSLKTYAAIYTCHRYLFFYLKYGARLIPKPITSTLLPSQNMKSDIYLPLVPVFLPKIWSQIYTWGMAGYMYLISHIKLEEQRISTTSTNFLTQNMKPNIYLRYGKL